MRERTVTVRKTVETPTKAQFIILPQTCTLDSQLCFHVKSN